ncbi:hypothetical protein EUX98_g7264 [Antrodiella citrinella]|uniref:Histone-lysine N-methyltransferase, H3 lysine-36 specific n=1 Tax=Antrodiella citrinella TaxID=2447956 RepID=A0A4S4MNX9_9APHY|nr:hypothetical protein EUX98_g7264 [Antrodiella citrinella]
MSASNLSSRSSSRLGERRTSALRSASGSREGTYTEQMESGVKVEEDTKVAVTREFKEEEDGDIIMGDASSPTLNEEASEEAKSEASDMKIEEIKTKSVTPPLPPSKTKKKPEAQLIGDLPRAEGDALKTFEELPGNHYQYGTLGRSREALESMTCDCQYEHGVDDPSDACGSDCINRLTQVECLPEDCRCHSFCGNQRFQRKAYADIHIVQTEKKGFGLRAGANLPKDQFIYEYVGDVVNQSSFLKRMRLYAEEGIRHFYFMMLQKDEYIDATKRGGIGRFANHSCNPNCYVAKWTVGAHVRMGIFANRNIKKDEELTFNYNVDRYGHDAQICYCGEPNCVGFIGGKTQTDIAAMDDLYLDALGISEEVEQLGLKGSKKKKGKKLDEDYLPTLKPLVEKDVPKVVQAMRQTQSRKVLLKLLTRVKITEDQSALRQIMRLRGFSVMTNILDDYITDLEIRTTAIECMMTWPLIQRNKVEDSKINVPVKECSESDDERLSSLAKKLLEQWDGLEYAYRIPKRPKTMEEDKVEEPKDPWPVFFDSDNEDRPNKRRKSTSPEPKLDLRPMGFRTVKIPAYDPARKSNHPPIGLPLWHDVPAPTFRPATKQDIAAVIAAAAESAAKAAAAAEAEAAAEKAAKAAKDEELAKRKAAKASKKHQSKEEKEANKEKRLLKLVGVVVVKVMSKYQKHMDHDSFKQHAKELTQIIADKEKKSNSYKEGKLNSLSEEKETKIKKFAKEYIAKILRKLEKKHKSKGGPDDTPGSSSTPGMPHGALHDSKDAPLSLADVVDMDGDDDDDDDAEEGEINEPPSSGVPSASGCFIIHSGRALTVLSEKYGKLLPYLARKRYWSTLAANVHGCMIYKVDRVFKDGGLPLSYRQIVSQARMATPKKHDYDLVFAAGGLREVFVKRMVILSAGALNTPIMLELSGIGAKSVLEQNGVTQIVDLPGVGGNFQDHLASPSQFIASEESNTLDPILQSDDGPELQSKQIHTFCKSNHFTGWLAMFNKDGTGMIANNGLDAGVKYRPTATELREIGPSFEEAWKERHAPYPAKPTFWLGIFTLCLDPMSPPGKYYGVINQFLDASSRGHVHIKSKDDPKATPDFRAGYLEE